jgi:tetratricopeptide (TPR) repeat protein
MSDAENAENQCFGRQRRCKDLLSIESGMSLRPAIYISAVSPELKSARQLVANTLSLLGYEPQWRDISAGETDDLRPELRRRIDSCKGVAQLVGNRYGPEPANVDGKFGRVSYSQYEALYAASKGKKVWYLFLDEGFPADQHNAEDEEKRKLQSEYRTRVKADSHLYYPLNSSEGLEASVLKLRDDLTRLRRGVKRWALIVALLLVASVGLTAWLLQSQRHSDQELQVLQQKFDKLQQGVNAFAEVQNQVRTEQPGRKQAEIDDRTYEELSRQLGVEVKTLKEKLPSLAQELKQSPNASAYARANAAYVVKDYDLAERLALAAADSAQKVVPAKSSEAIKDFVLAGWAAEKRVEYADALKHLREAEKLTNRTGDRLEWAAVQFAIARILHDQGRYPDEIGVLREVLKEREQAFGPDHPQTLAPRNNLALALDFAGKYPEAETETRRVLDLRRKMLGPEDPDTLGSEGNLAYLLFEQSRYTEAETEFRTVIRLQEKVIGPEHPHTLATRGNLANNLDLEGKYFEAETEDRDVIKLEEKVLGPEDPYTLDTRNNLANVLDDEGKRAEAEAEFRAVIKLRERVTGPEHPETLAARSNLGVVLTEEGKYAEAEAEDRAVLKLQEKVLGPEHPSTMGTHNEIAKAMAGQGKYAEAEAEARVVLELRKKVLGAEHPDTLYSRNDLAKIIAMAGRYVEAEAEDRAVLGLREKVLGVEHPDTLQTCFNLAVCLRAEGKLEEANALAKRAADGGLKVLGPDHPDTKKYEKLQQELTGG